MITRQARLRELLCRDSDDDSGTENYTALCSLDDGAAFTLRLSGEEYQALKQIPAAKRRRMVMTVVIGVPVTA